MAQMSVLIVATSNDRLAETDRSTGAWSEDIAVPYFYFKSKGYSVDFASPRGGRIPLDPRSVLPDVQRRCPEVRRFLTDVEAVTELENSTSIVFIRSTTYDAYYVAGGHGIMFDGACNKELASLLSAALAEGRCVATCGHGASALLGVKDSHSKAKIPYVAGNEVTGPTEKDDEPFGVSDYLPFKLSKELKQLRAVFCHADNIAVPFAVRAGKLITGQNSAAAKRVAELVVEAETLGVRITP